MSGRRALYAALVLGVIAAVAALRSDLLIEAARVTLSRMGLGWGVRLKLLGEIVLFGAILAAAVRLIPERADPARDVPVVLAAAAAGWLVEAWGTRNGLWAYYTGERPPLWIVPAWPMGALLVDRVSAAAEESLKEAAGARALAAGYWLAVLAWAAVLCGFLRERLASPGILLAAAALAAALLVRPDPRRDFWRLWAGAALVFLADLWGVTNGCWSYRDPSGRASGALAGIAFGAAVDAAVVLACLKSAPAPAGRSAVFGGKRALDKT